MDTKFSTLISTVLVIGSNAFAQTSPEIPASAPPALTPPSETATVAATPVIQEKTVAVPAPDNVVAAKKPANDESLPLCPPAPLFQSGYGLVNDLYPAAYNASARIAVKNSWDFFLSGSFLYWVADQDAMELAVNTTYVSGAYQTMPSKGQYVVPSSNYKPGLKLGFGLDFNYDQWVGLIEYTRFRQESTSSFGSPPADARGGTALWRMTDWFTFIDPLTSTFDSFAGDISSKWHTNIDLIDMTLSRPFYQGRYFAINPFGGLRIASIRQNFKVAITKFEGTPPTPVSNTLVSHNHSNSWAIGARAGLEGHWILGWGFRFEGDLAGNLLYSRFTSVAHREDTSVAANPTLASRLDEINTVRPMADMKLGMGWGTYYYQQKYHFDLLATYDFNVMWGQNMMRYLTNELYQQTVESPADLSVQGLSLTARFDF